MALMHKAAGVALPEDLYWNSLFTQAMMKNLWDLYTLDMRKVAWHGQKAPDPLLVDPGTGEEKQLLTTVDVQKLHVLAFGSYTCPVFRMRFKELKSLADEFHSVADFSVIYIDEAHPSDGWKFKVRFCNLVKPRLSFKYSVFILKHFMINLDGTVVDVCLSRVWLVRDSDNIKLPDYNFTSVACEKNASSWTFHKHFRLSSGTNFLLYGSAISQ